MEALAEFFHEYAPMLWQGLGETCLMTFGALLCSYALGLPLGVLLTLTAPGGMWRRKRLHALLGTITDVGRSVPFLILMLALIPFTRLVAGTTIGPQAALVPLVAGAAPFVARLVESALAQVDPNLVESARAWGATPLQIAWRVLLPEGSSCSGAGAGHHRRDPHRLFRHGRSRGRRWSGGYRHPLWLSPV